MRIHPRWIVAGLTATIVATAIPATAQVVDPAEPNLPAVQDPGPAFPLDQPIEVQLPPRAERALADGAGWEALEGVRFLYDGEEPVEAHVYVMLTDPDGQVLDSKRLDDVTIRRGGGTVMAHKELDFLRQRKTITPAAAYYPGTPEPYDPAARRIAANQLPDRGWDERHAVTNPDNMLKKGDRVAVTKDGVAADRDPDEVALAGNSTRMERTKPHVGGKTGGDDFGNAGGDNFGNAGGDNFLVITVVPADEDLRGKVPVRPLVIDLDETSVATN